MTAPQVRDGVTGARVADELREAILRGAYPPGTRLRQEELAGQYGASRVPVREALRILESDGLVRRTVFETVPPQVEYDLTDEGWTLVPALAALYEWGEKRAERTGLTIEAVPSKGD